MVRIAINVEQLFYRAPGGTGRYIARLVSSMAGQFSPDVVVPFSAWHRRAQVEAVFERSGLQEASLAPVVRLPLPRPALFDAWNAWAGPGPTLLSPSLRTADLVHNPFPAAPPVKVPLVVTVHDAGFALFPTSYPRRGLKFHVKALQRIAERADIVITGSQAALDEIVANSPISRDRVRVVAHGVDHRKATPEETAAALRRHRLDDAPYVMWVGSLEPRKNIGALVKAFVRLAGANELPHRLVLVGPLGWLHQGLITEQERAFLGDRLRSLGTVSENDLRALYAGASLFAFPSVHEGFGLPVLEAMVQGAPVVCSDIASLAEVAGGAAVLVPPSDVEGWARAIGEVAGDAGRREAMIAAGHRWAAQFSWDRTARETHAIYQELVER